MIKPNRRKLPKASRLNPLQLKKNTPTGKSGFISNQLAKKQADLINKKALPKSGQIVRPWNQANRFSIFFKKLKFWQKKSNPLTPNNRIKKPKWYRFTWRRFFATLGILIAVVALSIAGVFAYYVRDLPNPKEIANRQIDQSTQILDRNGKLIYSFYADENRTVTKSEDISDWVKKATIATEDANFYTHHGFDAKGFTRAVWCKVSRSCYGGGGSTITQQYIKNTLLTSEVTYERKLRELILALEIEQIYSKDEILTGYLNTIPYGGTIYGIEAASQSYFGKSAKDLTLSEAATLVSIPQYPSRYSPYGSHLDELFARKDYVLDRMVLVGSITKEEADAAKAEAPNNENPAFTHKTNITAPHFVFYVRQKLIDFIGGDPVEAEKKLDQGGYVVTTSLDLDTQKLGEGILADLGPGMVTKYQASNAQLSAVDPKSGEILAMVGSIDYDKSISGNTNFSDAALQPGSSFKPVVYATLFDQTHKMSPAKVFFDLETDFGNYIPHNYDGKWRGPITVRNALAQSLNIPAVKALALTGLGDSVATAEKMGITTLSSKNVDYGLSLVLGSGEVKPIEMAGAYATFANGGQHYDLRPILKIEQAGNLVKDFRETKPTQAIDPEVAYQITSILSDNNARSPVFGTRNNLTLPDRPVAAKTGSTNNNRDGWTIGYTPQIAVSVWVGNNLPNKTMSKGADGSYVAAPIWKRFMQEYHKGKPVEQFTRPDTMKEVTLDKLSGKLYTDQSPADQHITEWLAPWQIPTDTDNVHVKVKIDQVTGKLATDLTPAAQIIEQTFCTVHSELPDNPNWENPVLKWAAENNCNGQPPTTTDDLHVDANRPTLSWVAPTASSTIAGNTALTVNAGGPRTVTKVEFFVNNISVGSVSSAPWTVSFNADTLAAGTITLEAVATNDLGLTRTDQISVTKGPGGSPTDDSSSGRPGPVSSATAVLTGPRIIHFSWINPSDANLTSVNIYASMAADQLGNLISTISATPGSNTATDIHLNDQSYQGTVYFTLRPLNSLNKENLSNTRLPVKL